MLSLMKYSQPSTIMGFMKRSTSAHYEHHSNLFPINLLPVEFWGHNFPGLWLLLSQLAGNTLLASKSEYRKAYSLQMRWRLKFIVSGMILFCCVSVSPSVPSPLESGLYNSLKRIVPTTVAYYPPCQKKNIFMLFDPDQALVCSSLPQALESFLVKVNVKTADTGSILT